METEDILKNNSNHNIDNIMRWILFGSIIVVAPPLFSVWFKIIIGFNVDFIEYIPDMLLAMLSVSCNLLNTCVDSDKKIARSLRWILGIVLGLISAGCWGLFFVIRFISTPDWSTNTYYITFAEMLLYICTGVVLFCTITGIIIEWYSICKTNKKNSTVSRENNEK